MPHLAAPTLLTDSRVRAAYSEGAGIYRVIPAAVAVPGSAVELEHLVHWALRTGTPLVPRGAGSGMAGGNVGPGVIVDCTQGFTGLTVDPKARVARAGAGVSWRAITEAARPFGLRLPPDPSSGAFATSGGMVSTNAAGPRTVRYGAVRRWVESLRLLDIGGEIRTVSRGGGRGGPWRPLPEALRAAAGRFPKTRKNSSGYALDAYTQSGDELDLLIGSEGTLGFVTEVTWRLDPIPHATAGVAIGFSDLEALAEAVPFLVSLDPSAVELLDRTLLSFLGNAAPVPPGLACLLLVEFERETATAARGVVGDAVRGLGVRATHVETAVDAAGLERLWAVRRLASPALARLPETRRSLQVIEDGCVPLDRLPGYIAGVRDAAARRGIEVTIFGHAGDGHVHVNALLDLTRAGWREALAGLYADALELLVTAGGTPSGEHGDGRLRAGVTARIFGAEVMAMWRDLKGAYDPRGILNPGVILPAPDWSPLSDLKVGPDAAAIPGDIAKRLREVERSAGWGTPKSALTALTPDP